jgi:hypothetical protein
VTPWARIYDDEYDDRVVGLIRSGVATIAALRSELRIPGGAMKQVMTRLVRRGRIEVVRRGWYRAANVAK